MYIQLIVYVVVAIAAWYVFFKRGPKKGKPLPGPKGLPIIGFAHKLNSAPVHELFLDLSKKYGGIFHFNMLGEDVIVLNDAETVRSFFCDKQYNNITNDRPFLFWTEFVNSPGKGVFGTRNVATSSHGELRKSFARGMKVYGEGVNAFEAEIMKELVRIDEQLESLDGKEFDIQPLIKNFIYSFTSIILSSEPVPDDTTEQMLRDFGSSSDYFFSPDVNMILSAIPSLRHVSGAPYKRAFDTITRARDALGIVLSGKPVPDDTTEQMLRDFGSSSDYFFSPDVNMILSAIPSLRHVPGSPYKRAFDTITRARDALLQRYVFDAKKTYKPGEIRGLVDYYLNEQRVTESETFSDEQVCAMVLEIIPAGVATTLAHLSSYFLCLLNHPDYQTKIQGELDRVIGTDGQPSIADKRHCVWTEAVTLEVYRLLTTEMISGPRLCNTNFEFRGYDIPAKSSVLANLWFIHHDEKVWGDPWAFRPERWIGDDGALLPNDHVLRKNFMPFHTGRRGCNGESLARSRVFLFVTTLLQRWNFEMLPENAKSCDPRGGNIGYQAVCQPKPYLCRAVPRKRSE